VGEILRDQLENRRPSVARPAVAPRVLRLSSLEEAERVAGQYFDSIGYQYPFLSRPEFFGHLRGAFTGALRDRPGRFHLANHGTILLDEIGDLPLDVQPKLLRILQEGQYERVGDDTTRQLDVRVITATNRQLPAEVRTGHFRADLYYRLSVFPIHLPPIRARKEDIALLAEHFVTLAARKFDVPAPRITREQCEALTAYDWPGNVRELQNVIERAVILSRGGVLPPSSVVPWPKANLPCGVCRRTMTPGRRSSLAVASTVF